MSEREELNALCAKLAEHGWPLMTQYEHSIERGLLRHELWLTSPPKGLFRIVVCHPEACGCDLLPDEVVLHG